MKSVAKQCERSVLWQQPPLWQADRNVILEQWRPPLVRANPIMIFSKTLSIEQTHAQLFPVSMFGWENTFFAFIFPAPLIRLADFPTYGFCAIFLFVFVGRIFHCVARVCVRVSFSTKLYCSRLAWEWTDNDVCVCDTRRKNPVNSGKTGLSASRVR